MTLPYIIKNPLNVKEELNKFYKERGYTHCLRCKRKLTDPNSMFRRHGLVCYKKAKKNNKIIQLDLTFNKKNIHFNSNEDVKAK